MKKTMTLSVLMLALLLPTAAAVADSTIEKNTRELHPTLNQGLDRDRAAYRARILEAKRLEEEARRSGAGLDRKRSEMRAEKLAERRHQL